MKKDYEQKRDKSASKIFQTTFVRQGDDRVRGGGIKFLMRIFLLLR